MTSRGTGSRPAGLPPWPEGKGFAFTIMDDPDSQQLANGQRIYGLLADLGFRTTKLVWPLAPTREANSPGDTCADRAYLADARELAARGFEIGYHNATAHSSDRAETLRALNAFRAHFGHDPKVMANHYNAEAIYWGPARLGGSRRAVYNLLTRGQTRKRHFGHVEGHATFWGDLCRERIRYCRNFVFPAINTLRVCPWMPYHDPSRPYVNAWFAAAEGSNYTSFIAMLSEANQDRLEAEGGASIMYTHFAHGFTPEGHLQPRFRDLMQRLSRKNGWFVPAGELLDYLAARQASREIAPAALAAMERRWLWNKWLRGTS
jgi:hypothetical protein